MFDLSIDRSIEPGAGGWLEPRYSGERAEADCAKSGHPIHRGRRLSLAPPPMGECVFVILCAPDEGHLSLRAAQVTEQLLTGSGEAETKGSAARSSRERQRERLLSRCQTLGRAGGDGRWMVALTCSSRTRASCTADETLRQVDCSWLARRKHVV